MCITEYNEEKVMNAIRAEGCEKGLTEDRKEGIRNTIQIELDCGVNLRNVIVKTINAIKCCNEMMERNQRRDML